MNANRIKEIRLKNGYTLADIAKKTGYTASFLSQIERGLKSPSLEALRKISESLDVSIMTFIIDYDDSYLIRRDKRKKIVMPEIDTVYEFITPTISEENIRPNMVGLLTKVKPKSWVSEKMVAHSAQESMYVVKGEIEVHLYDKVYKLYEGDSFYIREDVPHNMFNPSDETSIMIGYISPAIY